MKKTFHIDTYGCQMNVADSELVESILLDQGANLIFEGNLANAYETTLTAVEPTADNTVSLPNSSGVLATEGNALAFSIVFGG